MFDDLYDALSKLWSSRWPTCEGEITAIDVERIHHGRGDDSFRLAVAYKFSLGDDGPYTGESFWVPNFCVNRRVLAARRKLRTRREVIVRYRRDDPSISVLDRCTWKDL